MIRPAIIDDFNEIFNIKNAFTLDINKIGDPPYKQEAELNGFLIPSKYTKEEFILDLHKVFLVYQDNTIVLGYIRIDEFQELRTETPTDWIKPELKEIYFSLPHACIGGIAVSPKIAKKGIASQLLVEAEKKIRDRGAMYLFSFVTSAPIMNIPSVTFHQRHTFEQIAVTKPHKIFGIENYQSILFAKNLSKT